jgi:hypothetical protein
MMRIATYAGISVTSLLLMTSTSLAQSFCSDVDRVVKLAPSGFRAVLDDSDRDPIQKRVTQRLPGALVLVERSALSNGEPGQAAGERNRSLLPKRAGLRDDVR